MDDFLDKKLNCRIAENALRSLILSENLIDFSSNDYLGFARSTSLRKNIEQNLNQFENYKIGSTGSRLLSGNSAFAESLESKIANFHQAESGLIFNSGYDANVGLFSAIGQKNDTIICDELVHASIIDGIRLSFANKFNFKHNHLNSLEQKLKKSSGNIFIAIESVYSMDGDMAPIRDIIFLAKKYNAKIIVDEAHATGVLGIHGEGLVQALGLENEIFARVVTFGKALACHGAIVLGSNKLKNYLVNFARSFIYSTALPIHSLVAIDTMYNALKENNSAQLQLIENINLFNTIMLQKKSTFQPQPAAIQHIKVPGNNACRAASKLLKQNNFDIRAILSPTVPKNQERLRICLHAFNTKSEIENVCEILSTINQ